MTNEIEAIARKLWDMQQRAAVQIAEKPPELREAAFAVVERVIRDLAKEMRIVDDKVDGFVEEHMKLIRQFVTEIDVGGSPKGGRA
jgi:hypothetical protein